jgi:hypothetical protein
VISRSKLFPLIFHHYHHHYHYHHYHHHHYHHHHYHHSDLPFKIVSFNISELQGTISYAAILHDGCKFVGKDIEIVIEPLLSLKKDNNDGKADKIHKDLIGESEDSFMKTINTDGFSVQQSEEGQDGLNFIANWIEIVLERLEVIVENLVIIINDPVSKISLKINLNKATFYNTNPRHIDNR